MFESSLLLNSFAVFLPKAFNSPSRIDKFLLAGKKWMTVGTDLYMDLFLGTLRLKRRTASALYYRIMKFGMDLLLHLFTSKFLKYY